MYAIIPSPPLESGVCLLYAHSPTRCYLGANYVVIKGANLTTPKCMQSSSFLALRFFEDGEGKYLPSIHEISRKGVDDMIQDRKFLLLFEVIWNASCEISLMYEKVFPISIASPSIFMLW